MELKEHLQMALKTEVELLVLENQVLPAYKAAEEKAKK